MSNAFIAPHFQTPELAREWLEKTRWPEGPVCSHCGTIGHAYKTKKAGWYRCAEKECRKDFTVTTGTVMERSHIPLNKWLMGFYMMSASKKGVSAHQLHRALAVDYKTAWFMCHRIREAMNGETFKGSGPLGGEGKIIESDGLSHRIDDPELADLGPEVLESIRAEIDGIVEAAQKIINQSSTGGHSSGSSRL